MAEKATGEAELSPLGCGVIGARFVLLIAMVVAVLDCLFLFFAQFSGSLQRAVDQAWNPLHPLLRLLREAMVRHVRGIDIAPLLAIALVLCARYFLDLALAAMQPQKGDGRPGKRRAAPPRPALPAARRGPATVSARSAVPAASEAELERLKGRPRDQLLAEIAASKRKAQALTGQERMDEMARVAVLQQALGAKAKPLAFLAVDVVGSARMKERENPLIIEHAFLAFRRWSEQILAKHNAWKSAWTPDGGMVAFRDLKDALAAGLDLLNGLKAFNEGGHEMNAPFQLRLGISYGGVIFDDKARMEEVSDVVIDLAGHLQKAARPDSLLIARRDLDKLRDRQGFRNAGQQVDGLEAWEWTAR